MSHYRQWSKVRYTPEFKDGEGLRRWGGGDQPSYAPPPAPAQPTVGQSAADYAASMPQIYQTQLEYQPKFAAMSKAIGESLYPTTAGLQENLAGQSVNMMNQAPPDWMKNEYSSNMRAQLGENVSSPIGADAYSTGLMRFNEDYRNQGRQLALSLAGRQQLVQAPSMTEAMGGYNPQSVMNFNQQGYGTAAGMASSMYGSANSLAASNYSAQMGLYGSLASGAASGYGNYMRGV